MVEIDLETIPMDDLRKLAEKEALKQSTKTPEEISEEEKASKETKTQPTENSKQDPFFVERSIDLGDGAGVQVFKGKGNTPEEAKDALIDKLAEAQKNATRKIREQEKTIKTKPIVTGPTKEEESLLAAELVTSPSATLEKILKSKGIDLNELKEVTVEVKQGRETKQRKSVADQFVIDHPEFLDNDRNGQRLKKAVALYGEFNTENLEKAYQDLNDSGLLEVKGEEAGDGQEKDKSVTGIPPKTEDIPSQRTKRASGLSTQRRPAVQTSATPSEDDMYTMPLDELRKRANQQLAAR